MAIPISKSAFGREDAVWIARRNLGLSGDGFRVQHPERIAVSGAGVAELDWDGLAKADLLELDIGRQDVARVVAMMEDLRSQVAEQAEAIAQLQADVARLTVA